MNALHQLFECGQSYWLDNLTRDMIKSGSLKQRVTEQGLRGVTSNPNIFHKAISLSDDYDAQLKQLVNEKRPIHNVYEQLVEQLIVTDVREACDILRPVYEKSEGVDGFVSLEVSPHLAYDTEG